MAEQGPTGTFDLAGQPAFLLNDPAAIQDVLVTQEARYRKSPGIERSMRLLGQGLLTASGRLHAARRKTVLPAFQRHRMDRYAAIMVAHAARRAARWRDGDEIDVVQEMTTLTVSVVGETLFSTDLLPLAPELRRILAIAVDGLDPLVALVAPRRRLRPAGERLHAIVQQLIDARLEREGDDDDLLGLLIAAGGPDATPAQLHDDVLTMLLAGHDTIANALTWTWSWLSEHPAAEDALHHELDTILGDREPGIEDVPRLVFTRAVLAESLRLTPPAWIIARTAIESHELAGVAVPAGALVLISPYLLHRDTRFFPAPLVFDPHRWLRASDTPRPKLAYLPFGAGRRSCVGEAFAWLEGTLVLATLARRWRVRVRSPREMHPRITLRPAGPLLAAIARRS